MSRPAPITLAAIALAGGLLGAAGCSGCEPQRRDQPRQASVPSGASSAPPAPPPGRVLADLVEALPSCDVDHRGLFFDAGTRAMDGRFGWSSTTPSGILTVEHDGSTWARITERKFQITFQLTAATPIFVAARAIGYAAKSASIALDEQPLGTLSFAREQLRVAQTGTTTLPVDPGVHTLSFRFFGRAKDGDAFADIDWIRVGVPDDSAVTYGPPTLRDVVVPAAALGGVPHRALALRAPGSVRCAMRPAKEAHLRTAVGAQGAGPAEAEIRVLVDGKKPEVVKSLHLEGGDRATWLDVDVPLAPFASSVAFVELVATSAPRGGRVLFGDPAIVLPSPPPPVSAPARVVVVVILDGVERSDLPPWSRVAQTGFGALAELAQSGATFDRHRAPTTVIPATVATLLTGLPPSVHGLTDTGARLSASVTTVAAVARDASVRTAMFTGVPYTFRAFGFASAWERFVEISPVSGEPAAAPIDGAAAWISEIAKASTETRMLAVVHARGGHPPWDVTPKQLSAAPPADYTGLIEPRRAAQIIAKMRRSKRGGAATDADRQRIRALAAVGIADQDRALGNLVTALKTANLWDATLFIVTGDAATGASQLYRDDPDLKEPTLTLPLYAHFPGGAHAGRHVSEPTEVADITRSILAALGLTFSKRAPGRDLLGLVDGPLEAPSAPQIATLESRYSARWGELVLWGRYPRPPEVCDLAIDPTCAFNRREALPIASLALFRSVVAAELGPAAPKVQREPATIDADTAAALSVWGAD